MVLAWRGLLRIAQADRSNMETLQQLRVQKQQLALRTAACLDLALAGLAFWAWQLLRSHMQQEGLTDRYWRRSERALQCATKVLQAGQHGGYMSGLFTAWQRTMTSARNHRVAADLQHRWCGTRDAACKQVALLIWTDFIAN